MLCLSYFTFSYNMARYSVSQLLRSGNMVMFMVFVMIGVCLGVFEANMPATWVVDVFTCMVMNMLVISMPGLFDMVDVRVRFMVVEMAATRVMDMVFIYVFIGVLKPDMSATRVMFMLRFMMMVLAVTFFMTMINMQLGITVG